jgi:phosphoribosylaminoimidazole carboxylase (NCAIR synthetase)
MATADVVIGDHRDPEALARVADGATVLTFDHEHVPTEHLHALQRAGHRVAPGHDERVHHLMAHWPDVKLHWYGKGQRRGRKLGHVTALGEDLAVVRGRAVAAARYLADGVVDPAFAFPDDHAADEHAADEHAADEH